MKNKRILTAILSMVATVVTVAFFGVAAVSAAELTEPVSGDCGNGVTWTLDVDGNFTVSGSGEMQFSTCPWNNYKDNIKSVTIEQGVTSVADGAFASLPNLKKVDIANSVKKIGYAGFAGSSNLSEINLPDSITEIGAYSFTNTALKNVTLPSRLQTVSANLFSGCLYLESVYIPDSVTVIEESVFSGSSVRSVRLSANITYIPPYMFSSSKIETIELPSSIREIGYSAFYDSHLTTITLPEGVEIIGKNVFEECDNLKTVKLPSTLRSIGEDAFRQTINLERITIPGNVEEIKTNAFAYSGIKSLIFNEGPDHVFIDLNSSAFANCSKIRTIEFSSNIRNVADSTFSGCSEVDTIIFNCAPADIKWDFQGHLGNFIPSKPIVCYVPSAYLEAYKTAFPAARVTFKGDHEDVGIGEVLSGYSLSLEGDIGVNFYLRFYDIDAISDNAKMIFTISSIDGSNVKTQQVYVKPQTDSAKPYASQKDGYYVFKCVVNAKEMTSKITAQIVDGDDKGSAYTYTVQDYAKYMLTHPDKYANEQELIKAMLVYGAASQDYFNYNTSNFANSILSTDDRYISLLSPDDLNAGARTEDLTIAGTDVKIAKARLVLGTTISEKLYFTGVNDNTVFKHNNKVLKPVKEGEYYVVTIEGIQAQYIRMTYGIRVYDGTHVLGTVNYSPLYYCRIVLDHEFDEIVTYSLKYLISTIVNYSQAAQNYYPMDVDAMLN